MWFVYLPTAKILPEPLRLTEELFQSDNTFCFSVIHNTVRWIVSEDPFTIWHYVKYVFLPEWIRSGRIRTSNESTKLGPCSSICTLAELESVHTSSISGTRSSDNKDGSTFGEGHGVTCIFVLLSKTDREVWILWLVAERDLPKVALPVGGAIVCLKTYPVLDQVKRCTAAGLVWDTAMTLPDSIKAVIF